MNPILVYIIILEGLILFITCIVSVIGIAKHNWKVSLIGSTSYYLPTLMNFITTMTLTYTGFETVSRLAEMLKVEDISWYFVNRAVGDVFLVPYWLLLRAFVGFDVNFQLFQPMRDAYGYFFLLLGCVVLAIAVYTWVREGGKGTRLIQTGIYRFSRHPQYLGVILIGYGLMILTTFTSPWRFSYAPTFNWFVSSLLLVGLALSEETKLRGVAEIGYSKYSDNASFMIPFPRAVRRVLAAPFQFLWRGEYPRRTRSILLTLAIIYLFFLVLYTFGKDYLIWLRVY